MSGQEYAGVRQSTTNMLISRAFPRLTVLIQLIPLPTFNDRLEVLRRC